MPICGLALKLGAATKTTLLDPALPDEVIVSQLGLLLTAVQPQTLGAITPTDPVPPEAGTVPFEDCKVYEHVVPDWTTFTD